MKKSHRQPARTQNVQNPLYLLNDTSQRDDTNGGSRNDRSLPFVRRSAYALAHHLDPILRKLFNHSRGRYPVASLQKIVALLFGLSKNAGKISSFWSNLSQC